MLKPTPIILPLQQTRSRMAIHVLSVRHPFDGDIDILSSDHSPSDLEHKLFVEGQVRKSLSAKPHADGYFISLKVEQKKPTKPENEPSKPGYTSSVAAATTFRCF
uniref:Putative plant transcription factor n=1 Tax=Helianthus annuus TaxID=4232 RepID=A0A251UQ99_HELAN